MAKNQPDRRSEEAQHEGKSGNAAESEGFVRIHELPSLHRQVSGPDDPLAAVSSSVLADMGSEPHLLSQRS
jgi:hypothetical protein